MSANTEKCSDKDKTHCEYNEFRRLRYFHGMLLDDKDFRAEQQYHAGKRRFLNRMLHGSGVVCGLELKGEKGKRYITITSGLALDCSGNEIWVPEKQKIDLGSLLPPKKSKAEECGDDDVKEEPDTYYIGIRYQENPTSPVSVYLPSGSCEERTCENSRWKEGYCIEIVNCCRDEEKPGLIKSWCDCGDNAYTGDFKDLCGKCGAKTEQSANPAASGNVAQPKCKCMTMEEFCEQSVPCGECCSCDKPCFVILGQIQVGEKCLLQKLCMNECRRYVLTGRLVQNLLARVLGGSEDYFQLTWKDGKEKLPTPIRDYIYNPIKALCWWLPKQLQGGTWKWLDCKTTEDDQPPPPLPRQIVNQIESEVSRRVEVRLNERMELHLKNIRSQLGLETLGAADLQAADEKAKQKVSKKPGS